MTHSRRTAAFTRRELVVVIAVLFVLVLFLIPVLERVSQKSKRISCVCNLKVMGLAYRIWSNDNGDHYPANAPLTNGGWSNLLSRANASTYVWRNYATISNELGQNLRTLVCPADERKPARSFSNLANMNISYFVGVNANDNYPVSILGGDRNLGPGTTPDPQYGYSPADGRGNDVTITGPVCWSRKMHSRGIPAGGGGNILLGDGSSQQVTSGNLNQFWLKNAVTTNAAFTNATNPPALRLIFP
jgi:competence protein ComGC